MKGGGWREPPQGQSPGAVGLEVHTRSGSSLFIQKLLARKAAHCKEHATCSYEGNVFLNNNYL